MDAEVNRVVGGRRRSVRGAPASLVDDKSGRGWSERTERGVMSCVLFVEQLVAAMEARPVVRELAVEILFGRSPKPSTFMVTPGQAATARSLPAIMSA
jgi:hypothetical protein